mmetsp:Transcript_35756/g.78286  ORF Transcript_35756/g.78286 Transcript_35756/m.78286 type:complete len:180 (-) Transcript_35756:149-688(-)|eukprot:CAMPEP_0178644282 /NCGR_PEP_ID=MMETSP0698-20121128/18200_1 /TAXON_ID=265572 /ORGANISM="Extubocellulus spinifer, Strain CCMP396" /LENGTH=179 /DNA_ID=CAMNT_0020285245 /DNA_START=294 /DNA_END=833 /DNA_ORIENTATION=-
MPTDTPLHKASHNGDLRAVQQILDEASQVEEKVNAPGAAGRRPIHRAAGGDHAQVVELLISAGAKVDASDQAGRTALHWASISGNVESATMLLEKGANPMSTTTSKLTPLHFTSENGKADLVSPILSAAGEKKMNLFEAQSAEGKTAAALAKDGKHKAVVKALKEAGDPNASSSGCLIS